MTGRLFRFMLIALFNVCLGASFFACQTMAAEEANCTLAEEEYAVMAAALFPEDPQLPDTITGEAERQAYRSLHSVRMDGIPDRDHRLSNRTSPGHVTAEGKDRDLLADFNRQNLRTCSIVQARLATVIPKGCSADLVPPPKFSLDAPQQEPRGGTTYLSRAGFDTTRTRAVIQISHVAAPEMGAGYLVYLEKSSPNGPWRIVDAVLNRRY